MGRSGSGEGTLVIDEIGGGPSSQSGGRKINNSLLHAFLSFPFWQQLIGQYFSFRLKETICNLLPCWVPHISFGSDGETVHQDELLLLPRQEREQSEENER